MPRVVIVCGARPETVPPSNTISPESSRKIPVMSLKTVVLPAPFGPIRLTTSPSPTTRSRLFTTWSPPKAFETSRSWSSATSDDLHARGAKDSRRPHVHDHDEQRPEHDQPRRAGHLLDELVLPHERRQIQGRDQRD